MIFFKFTVTLSIGNFPNFLGEHPTLLLPLSGFAHDYEKIRTKSSVLPELSTRFIVRRFVGNSRAAVPVIGLVLISLLLSLRTDL